MVQTAGSYGADSMQVLEGLDPVRKRPGMYIGSTGPTGLHHCVWEVVDNSVDEAMAGRATRIDITLLADGGCRVTDDGQGIPTDVNKQQKMTGVEIALTKLHGGGKFGGEGYKVSGGLHGVGVSVVNALSKTLIVEVDQHGKRHRMEFGDGGKVKRKLEVVGDAPRGRTGTTITFWPDPTVFETVEFSARTILERLQMMAFLNKGLEIRFKDERPDHRAEPVTYRYAGGIIDFVKHVNTSKEALFAKVGYYDLAEDDQEVDVAFQWNTGYNADGIHSFANGINTTEGGAHEEGFKAALTTVVNKHARAKNLLKEKDPNLQGEDIREGITAIISVRLRDPQFEGQTKAKLGNTSMKTLVQKATNDKLGQWFEENPTEANKIVKKAIAGAQARMAAKKARRRHPLQDPARRRRHARQAQGLQLQEPRRARAVHRRGRLRRRLRGHGPRPAAPGHPPDPRQDPERRAGPARQDAEEPRGPGPHLRHRRRGGGGVRRREAALRQGLHPGRRRRRRPATSARCCSRSSSGRCARSWRAATSTSASRRSTPPRCPRRRCT